MDKMVQDPDSGSDNGNGMVLSRRRLLAGAGGVILAGTLAGCGGGKSSPSSAATRKPNRGGTFRLGATGGGSKDMIDGQTVISKPDIARLLAGYESLSAFDGQYKLVSDGGLAEEVVAEKPDQWLIRVRSGIEFHNGKTLSAEDVVYSLQRILDPKRGLYGYGALSYAVDPTGIKKVDDRTVRLTLTRPDSTIGDQMGQYFNAIVPVGHEPWPAPQVGTGPFKLASFKPGEQSIHVRHPNYWRNPEPWFDQVAILDFQDPTALFNALQTGQIDAMTDLPAANVAAAKQAGLSVLVTKTGNWQPICMAVDMPPFTDNRVRQAMRLAIDRPQTLEQVLSGYGSLGNDLFSPQDEMYSSDIPQRDQDIEQAKSLLKSAGQEGLTIDLHTTNGTSGMVDLANVFANQAAASGMTINVRNDPNYYGDAYLKLAFSVDYWGTHNFLPQVAACELSSSAYNETHWPPKAGAGSNYGTLYADALAEIDQTKRRDIIHEMQTIEYDSGGYIIPYFNNSIDASSSRVDGLQSSKGSLNLDWFGHGFRTIWFRS
jgi:peptide/nickel transport system substrate-binding protein